MRLCQPYKDVYKRQVQRPLRQISVLFKVFKRITGKIDCAAVVHDALADEVGGTENMQDFAPGAAEVHLDQLRQSVFPNRGDDIGVAIAKGKIKQIDVYKRQPLL